MAEIAPIIEFVAFKTTPRELFAALAMQSLIVTNKEPRGHYAGQASMVQSVAQQAVGFADALLAELSK